MTVRASDCSLFAANFSVLYCSRQLIVGSARAGEAADARAYDADIITAYETHGMGMDAVPERIPDGGLYYLTIDAGGIDPTIMPGVLAQAPGVIFYLHFLH